MLRDYLKNFINDFNNKGQIGVLNCIKIISYARNNDLSNEDLSQLDLRRTAMNGMSFSSKAGNACFEGSFLSDYSLLPTGHNDSISSVAFSPDGSFFATASYDKSTKIWNLETGELERILDSHEDGVACVAYSPNNRFILTSSHDGFIRMWNNETGNFVKKLGLRDNYGELLDYNKFQYSPDSRFIVAYNEQDTFGLGVGILDGETGDLVKTLLKGHLDELTSVTFSPDSNYLVTTSCEYKSFIWKSKTGELVRELDINNIAVRKVAFSPCGNYMLVITSDNVARLLNNETGATIKIYEGHDDAVYDAVFIRDGKYVVTVSSDTLRLLNRETGDLYKTISEDGKTIRNMVCSPDNKFILTVINDEDNKWSNVIHIWDIEAGTLANTINIDGLISLYSNIVYSNDGRFILITVDSVVYMYSKTGDFVRKIDERNDWGSCVAINPDGTHVVTSSTDGIVRVWDVRSVRLVKELNVGFKSMNTAIYSPDGTRIVTTARSNSTQMWNSKTGEHIKTFGGHEKILEEGDQFVKNAKCSPDGRHIITIGNWDIRGRIWESEAGKLIEDLPIIGDLPINDIDYSPDSKFIAMATIRNMEVKSSSIYILNSKTYKWVNSLEGHADDINNIAYSHCGKFLVSASSDNTARTWDSKTGRLINELIGHTDRVNSAIFSPDNKYIITTSKDGTARIWDAISGEPIRTFIGNKNPIYNAVYSPDGEYVITSSSNCMIFWDTLTGEMVDKIPYFSGLNILDCSFKNAMFTSENLRNIARQYGGKI